MDDIKSENIKSDGGARKDEFKLFVGGLSYKMDDAGLREGARYHPQQSVSLISQGAIPVLSLQVMFPVPNADPSQIVSHAHSQPNFRGRRQSTTKHNTYNTICFQHNPSSHLSQQLANQCNRVFAAPHNLVPVPALPHSL